jgi:hypothetical protein
VDRDRRATERSIGQAKFRVVDCLDRLDFLAITALNKTLVLELTAISHTDRFCGERWFLAGAQSR